jgi:hypothetical protein
LEGEKLYHDFRGRFETAGDLSAVLVSGDQITQQDALRFGISPARWQEWFKNTWLVPAW